MREHSTVAAVVLAFCVVRLFFHGLERDLRRARSRLESVSLQRLDPRSVSWRDLVLIPGIGDAVARRLAARLRTATRWDELLGVHGVGPATLDRLRPHLERPLATPAPPPDDRALDEAAHAPVSGQDRDPR